jgi:hypothetical protein
VCAQCPEKRKVKLRIKTDKGPKTISGMGPEPENKDLLKIVMLIKNLVGYTGDDFRNRK